jgi:signal transduction histidine kinase
MSISGTAEVRSALSSRSVPAVEDRKGLRVAVEDEGTGFSEDALSSGGLGLADIRERIGAFDGHLRVRAKAGGGTRAVVEVPRGGRGAERFA